MKFAYQSGYRPLEGYTLKRGIGYGGFGEVYFALTDGGKEVAMKVINRNLDVELRGMTQCLNFKHQNLVDLYDIRTDPTGNYWVIMEYVAGDSLNKILSRHPNGVAPELASQWFLGIAAAISYLHEHGIVHRDLKPANIFIENGIIKVGDYGLCKFISENHRSAQTRSVGTVYYMAPEISTGNYNRQIDIYSAGILLYEMLTGQVPFDGQSPGEVIAKHLTEHPDLSRIPNEFVPILSKALSKNTAHRYKTIREMSKDVETVYCEEMPRVQPAKPLYQAKPIPAPIPAPPPKAQPVKIEPRAQITELCSSLLKSTLLVGVFSILWAGVVRTNNLAVVGQFFFLSLASCWAVLTTTKLWTKRVPESLGRRGTFMCVGFLVGLLALWLEGHQIPELLAQKAQATEQFKVIAEDQGNQQSEYSWTGNVRRFPVVACYLTYFGVAFFLLRWWQLVAKRRSKRFSFYSVFAAGLLGFLLTVIWPGADRSLGIVTLVITAVVIQLVSPWQPTVTSSPRKLRLPNA